MFYRMKFLLTRNKRGGVPSHKTYVRKNIHVFAGLLRCGQCGSNMTANLDRRRANGFRPSQPEVIEPAARKVHMISEKIEAPENPSPEEQPDSESQTETDASASAEPEKKPENDADQAQ